MKLHREVKGKIGKMSITKTPTGKYSVSIFTAQPLEDLPKTNKQVGIDLGLKDFLIPSDNKKFKNNRYLKKYAKQLKKAQQHLSRKQKGSNGFEYDSDYINRFPEQFITFSMPVSTEKVGKAIEEYSSNTLLDLQRYELIIFSFITGNNDMHLKNFSLFLDTQWKLSPPYDLLNVNLHLPEGKEEEALALNGKKRRLKQSDFVILGKKLGLNDMQIGSTFSHFRKKKRI